MERRRVKRRVTDRPRTVLDQRQEDRLTALEDAHKEILDMLRPISETYRTATTLGKWTMAALVFASVTVGVLLGVKNLFKPH